MDKKTSTSPKELIAYFITAFVFALLSIAARKLIDLVYNRGGAQITLHLGWIFWLCSIASFICILPLIRVSLVLLSERGFLPKAFGQVVQLQLGSRLEPVIERIRFVAYGISGRLIFGGVGIMIVSIILWRTGAIHDDEISSNLYRLVHQSMGRYATIVDRNTVCLNFFSHTRGDESYQSYFWLVRDLQRSGVKAVLIVVPSFPTDSSTWRLLKELQNTGIVVFASRFNFKTADSLGEFHFSKGALTLSEHELDETEPLSRIRPTGMAKGILDFPDVTIELLRKYKGYPNDLSPSPSDGEVRFGDFRIPVTRSGWMYSLGRNYSTSASLLYVDSSFREQDLGAKFFPPGVKGTRLKLAGGPAPFKVRDVGDELRGKIVILLNGFSNYSYNYPWAYAVALENMIKGNTMKKSEQGHLWLSLLCLVIVGSIACWFRPLVTILLVILLAVATVFFGYYLYQSQNILIDIFYPLLALAMSLVAFPAITLGRRVRLHE